jgi:hypothetical protein
MSEEKQIKLDTIHLLRAVMKVSSALNDLDEVVYRKKYYKFRFKQYAAKWAVLMEMHTKELMKSLLEEDHALLQEIYNSIEDGSTGINAGEDKTSLILFYAKLKSAINDINKMDEHKGTFYPVFIDLHTKVVIEHMEKQYGDIINMKDVDDKGVEEIIKFFDSLGETIMTYDK